MAEEASSEKQHQASAKRIADLRKQGQTMRSRDLSGGLVLLSTGITLIYLASHLQKQFFDNFITSFQAISSILQESEFPGEFLRDLVLKNFTTLLPLFGLSLTAALASPFLFGGWNFSMGSVEFKFEKLNPMKYIKNIFSMRIYMEVIRAIAKVAIIFGVMLFFIIGNKHYFNQLTMVSPKLAIYGGFALIEKFVVVMGLALMIVVAFDMLYHYFEYQQRVKMTTQELKDENKESDGNPEVKRKIRSKQYGLMRQHLSKTVPKADVIITNPTHYAVALSYDDQKHKAPKIVAKGKDYIAHQIRQLAIANSVPIYEAPPLARAVYHTGNIGSEIHHGLYMAVAIVLSYVQQLRNYQQGFGQPPVHTTELQIPDELFYAD